MILAAREQYEKIPQSIRPYLITISMMLLFVFALFLIFGYGLIWYRLFAGEIPDPFCVSLRYLLPSKNDEDKLIDTQNDSEEDSFEDSFE